MTRTIATIVLGFLLVAMVIINRDIGRRRRAEEALRERQELLTRILDTVADGIYLVDRSGRITKANPAAERILGIPREQIEGRAFDDAAWKIMTVDGRPFPHDAQPFVQIMRTGQAVFGVEQAVERPDGTRVTLAINAAPLRDGTGVVVGEVASFTDITERKHEQQVLERLLHQNELILSSAGEGILGLDEAHRCTFTNPTVERLTGYGVEELLGEDFFRLLHHSRTDGTPHPPAECPVYATLRDGVVSRVADEVLWRKDGTSFPIEYVSAPIRQGGRNVGAVVIFQDITQRLLIDRMRDEFVSMVSHELRTPLTSIRGALGLLAGGLVGSLSEKGQRMVDIAVENTDRLARLVNDILDVERMESGRVVMDKRGCVVGELMTQAADVMRAMADAAGVTLQVSPNAARVWADPDSIIQTITNLLSNAVKYSPRGGTVWLNAAVQGDDVLVQVRDQGRGIPADKLGSVFERFQQVDASDSRQKGGTGLGLTICRSIVQAHGGRIWAESAPGAGTTFSFTLPLLRDDAGVRSGSAGDEDHSRH